MNRIVLVGVMAIGLGAVGGCITAERAAGITRDAQGNPVSDGTGGIAGTLLNFIIPGAATVVAAGAAAYANAKRGQWKEAALSTFETIEAAGATPQGQAIKAQLAEHHKTAGVYKFVKSVLDTEGINKP